MPKLLGDEGLCEFREHLDRLRQHVRGEAHSRPVVVAHGRTLYFLELSTGSMSEGEAVEAHGVTEGVAMSA